VIDLTTKALPNTVTVHGVPFSIKTDYRLWMRFVNELKRLKNGQTIEVGYLFVNDHPARFNISDLFTFAFPASPLPRSIGNQDQVPVIDYELDGDLIFAAFMGQYGIDLLTVEDLHWHKFLALLKGLNETTMMREVMGYRSYKKKSKNDEDQMERLRFAWQIDYEEEISDEELEAFSDLFS